MPMKPPRPAYAAQAKLRAACLHIALTHGGTST